MATQIWQQSVPLAHRQSVLGITMRGSSYNRQWAAFITALVAIDAIAVWAGLMLAYEVRIASGIIDYDAAYNAGGYALITLISIPLWLLIFAALRLYKRDNLLGGLVEYQQAIKACAAGVIALIVLSFLSRELVMASRLWLFFSLVLTCLLVTTARFVMRRVGYWLRKRGYLTARVLIVGANDQGVAVAEQWLRTPTSGMQVVGFIDDFKPIGTPVLAGLTIVGQPSALVEIANRLRADEVIVVLNAIAWESFEELVGQAGKSTHYTLRMSPGFYELLTTGVAVMNKTFVPLFTINDARIVGIDAVFKAALDYGLGIAMTLVMAPVLVVIAIALKFRNRDGKAFERLPTIGHGGKRFTMYKLHIEGVDPLASQPKPTRRFEKFLFRTGLDKLPQLTNVLQGKMSLVGPRPRVVDSHQHDPRTDRNLQAVKPGIVGPWSVSETWTSLDETRDDVYYVRNWTIGTDLQIIFQTALVWFGFTRKGPSDGTGKSRAPAAEVEIAEVGAAAHQ